MRIQSLPSLAALALLSLPARADFITGQVVDQFGVGVGGVDIDVKNLGSGGTPPIFNDGTDPSGFFTTTLPAGLYRVTFTPPAPPATSHLITEVDDVIVVGTKNMGVISLPPGVLVTGRVRNSAGVPVAGVNLDVIDEATGDNLPLVGDTTDAFGEYAIAAPATAIELRFKTAGVVGQTLAPKAMALTLTGSLALGDLDLKPGHRIQGVVIGPGGVPVENADFDLWWTRTGADLFTPGDNTDGTGFFSIVVPAGLLTAGLCPMSGEPLVGRQIDGILVNGDVNLGVVALQAGVRLSGTMRAFDGSAVAGADIDVKRADGTPVYLCGDNSNGAGAYSVIVPTGTLDLEFEPPGFSLPLGIQDVTAVPVSGNTLLDASLPACPFGTPVGASTPGAGGFFPALAASGGAPRVGNKAYGFDLTGGLGGAVAFMTSSLTGNLGPRGFAMPGFGTQLGDGPTVLSHGATLLSGTPGLAAAGTAFFGMPVDSSLAGISMVARAYVLDPDAAGALARTNGVVVTFCE